MLPGYMSTYSLLCSLHDQILWVEPTCSIHVLQCTPPFPFVDFSPILDTSRMCDNLHYLSYTPPPPPPTLFLFAVPLGCHFRSFTTTCSTPSSTSEIRERTNGSNTVRGVTGERVKKKRSTPKITSRPCLDLVRSTLCHSPGQRFRPL